MPALGRALGEAGANDSSTSQLRDGVEREHYLWKICIGHAYPNDRASWPRVLCAVGAPNGRAFPPLLFGLSGLPYQAFLKQRLHVSPAVKHTMDEDSASLNTIAYAVGLVSNLAKFRDTYTLKFWGDVTSQGESTQGFANPREGSDEPISLRDGIVQRNVAVDIKEIILRIIIYNNIIFSHS